jgi:RHS repeat-associated protein
MFSAFSPASVSPVSPLTHRKQRIVCRCIVLALAVLLTSAVAHGQTAEFTQGSPGANTMSLQVPLGSYPGRGLSLPINLNYSSRVWRLGFIKTIYYTYGGSNPLAEAIYSEYATAGWTTSLDVPLVEWPKQNDAYWYTGKPYTRGTNYPYTFRVARVFIHMPDGSTHELRKADQVYQDNGSIDMAGSFYAVDGSRMRYDGINATTGTLYLADGTRYLINSSTVQCIDRNGNTLTYDRASRQWTDTMGRTIGMPWPANPQAGTDYSYALPAVGGGTHSYTLKFKSLANSLSPNTPALKPVGDFYLPYPDQPPTDYNGSNFTQATQSASMFVSGFSDPEELNYQTYTRVIGRGQPGNIAFNPVVLAEVVLPNGLSYKFSYNNYGELDKVIYPGGSYQRYQFGEVPGLTQQTIPYPQVNRGLTSRWLSANGAGNDEMHWLYGFDAGGWSVTAPGPTGAANGIKTVTYLYTGGTTQNNFGYDSALIGMPYDERVYAYDGGPMVRRTLTSWATSDQTYTRPGQGSGTYTATRNPRPTKTVSLILDTGGAALTSAATSQYDTTYQFTYGVDHTQSAEYGFTTVDQTTAQTGVITAIPMGALVRSSETAFVTDSNYLAQNILGLVSSTTVKNAAGTIVSQSSAAYDEGAYPLLTYGSVPGWTAPASGYRGNLTTASHWLDYPSPTWISTHTQYDQCGSVRNAWDARGSLSQIEYSSGYAYAYPTQSTSAVPDPSGIYGQTVSLVSTGTFDFNTGLSISATDANGKVTTFEYYDPLNRSTKVNRPDGGWSITNYNDTVGNAYVHSQTLRQATPTQETMDSYEYFDKLGRGVRSFAKEGSTYLTSDTQYDSLGRVWRVSNPYRTSLLNDPVNPSGNWTTNTYDSLNRVVAVTAPDGAQVTTQYPAVTTGSYIGTSVLVGDPSPTSKKRQSVSDAQGRMIQVIEDPAGVGYQTNYTYDVLNNLRQVEQGTQLRYFAYDSLSRPIRARNVEQVVNTALNWTDPVTGYYGGWTAGISYDNNGNVTTRVDARNITTTYGYDALNRNTTVRYTDGTKDIDRHYDGAINGKGRFWYSNWDASNNTRFDSHTAIDEYDVMGQPKNYRQHFLTNAVASPQFNVTRTYGLAGQVLTQTYPSGHTVTYTYDAAGRINNYSGNLGDGVGRTYSSGITYSEFGGLQQEQFGTQTALFHKLHYNVRGQVYDIRLSTVPTATDQWDWNRGAIVNYFSQNYQWQTSDSNNNGNVLRSESAIPLDANANYNSGGAGAYATSIDTYAYDSLNRLSQVQESQFVTGGSVTSVFNQAYSYDRFGNRTINQSGTTSNVPHPSYTADANTNQLVAPTGYSYAYDNAGNQTNDTYTGAGSREYDAENHLKRAQGSPNNQWQTYTYDAGGKRIKRNVNGVETWAVYGMSGELIAEYAAGGAAASPQKEYGYRNGELLVTAEPPTGQAPPLTRQNVTWTSLTSNVQATGNTIQKTSGTNAWDGGASSTQTITGDGYVEFTPAETGTWRMCGLGNGVSWGYYPGIEYAIFIDGSGGLSIYEAGNYRGAFGSYAAADRLKVAVENGVVKYYRNTTLLYTSTVTPQYPLLVDASLNTVNAGVYDVVIANNVQSVTWSSLTSNVQATGNTIQKASGTNAWDGGASSTQTIASGDGYVEFTPAETGTWRMCGLGNGVSWGYYPGIEYAIFIDGSGGLSIYEAGNYRGAFGSYAAADRLKVAVENGVVKYYRNSTLLYTSTVTPQYPLLVDASLNTVNAGVYNVVITSTAPLATGNIKWLVTDQLGTPRMIADQTGSLAGVKRHDYLPFGEEIGGPQVALLGARTSTSAFTGDSVRQHFTGYEADGETNLNYAQARYQSPVQGRFTSVDPLGSSANIGNPQSFNRYSYVNNNPINLTDPSGLMAGADQGWSSVSSDFWGSSAGFNNPHFGGPEVVGEALILNHASESKWLAHIKAGMSGDEPPDGDYDVIVTYTTAFATRNDALDYYAREYGGNVTERHGTFMSGAEPNPRAGKGFGWGFTGNAHGFAGIGLGGVGGTGGAFGGEFANSEGRTSRGGGLQGGLLAYFLAGARARTPRAIVSAPEIGPDESASIVGASTGIGGGLFVTNAGSPEELRGPFDTTQINTPWIGVQYDTSGGVNVFSFTLGPTVGYSYFHGKTGAITTPSLPAVAPLGGTIVR